MNLNSRLRKLREEKQLIIERLRLAEAKALTRKRKEATRAKIILGAVVLAMPEGEREALLSMLLPRTVERDRQFITEHLSGDKPAEADSSRGLN